MTTTDELRPRCVAQAAEAPSETFGVGLHGINSRKDAPTYFYEANFSADGTALITHTTDHSFTTFILPVDLLDDTDLPHVLNSHRTSKSATPVQSYACYPHFKLDEPSTTVFLASASDLPIALNNALYSDIVHAKYPLVNPTTEAYIAPSSLAWTLDGSHFVAGSRNQISVFDSSYDGSGPFIAHKTAVGRKERQVYGAGAGCKGIVAALSISPDGVLAAGTDSRQIGLYAQQGSGECVTSFSLTDSSEVSSRLKGTGIMHLAWSPCGTYLLAAERQSECIQVYDVRNTMQRVGWLSGRKADTTQRLSMEVVPTANGYEVWAGGTDGCVRMWRSPGSVEGQHEPDTWMQAHRDPVASTIWHPGGAVMATCSSKRRFADLHSDDLSDEDIDGMESEDFLTMESSIKIWTL